MSFPWGIKRTIGGLLLQVIFVAFLVHGSLGAGLQLQHEGDEETLCEYASFEIFSFSITSGSENTQTPGIKSFTISGSCGESIPANFRFLLSPLDIAPAISRFLCNVFYVFISSKAP